MSKIRLRHSHPLLRGSAIGTPHGHFKIDHEGIFEVPTDDAHALVEAFGDINYADPADARPGSAGATRAVQQDMNDLRAKIEGAALDRGEPKPMFRPEPIEPLVKPAVIKPQKDSSDPEPPVLHASNRVDAAGEARAVGSDAEAGILKLGKKPGKKAKGKR